MSPTRHPSLRLRLSTLALALLAPTLAAQDPALTTVIPLLGEGDVLPAAGSTMISIPDGAHYVPGGFAAKVPALGVGNVIESSTGVGLQPGTVLADGRSIDKLYNTFDVDSSGRLVTVARLLDEEGFEDGQAVLLGDEVLIDTSDLALPGLAPNRRWVEFDVVRFERDDRLLVVGFTDIFAQPNAFEYLAMSYDVGPTGGLSGAEIVLRTGDLIDGRHVSYVNAVFSTQLSLGSDGTRFLSVGLSDTPGGPWQAALVLGDQVLAEFGGASPVPGYTWLMNPGESVARNGRGDTVFASSIWNGVDGEDVLIVNGAVLVQTGQEVPGMPGSRLISIGGPHLAEDGRVLWYGGWIDAGFQTHTGLFVDHQLWLESFVTPIDGLTDALVGNTLFQLDIHPDGHRVLFAAKHPLEDTRLYEARLDQWVDLGGGLAGGGPAPVASGLGVLEAGAPVSVGLTGAPAGGSAWLVVGLSLLGAPFQGGTLCPNPDVVVAGLPVDGAGSLTVADVWPAGIPAGTDLWWQFWTADPGGPAGFFASNCLEVQTF